jgi:Lrp/AsnC family leucine-responsive transcriptional regulator
MNEDNLTILGSEPLELDRVDTQLLQAIQLDAKASLAALGEIVGLSAPAVMERIKKLEQAGAILGYHAHVDGRRVGLDIAAFIGVAVQDPGGMADIERWGRDRPEVLECHHVTGAYTLLLKVKARNTRALELLVNALRSMNSVRATDTMVVFSTGFERTPVPIDVPAEEASKRRRNKKNAS